MAHLYARTPHQAIYLLTGVPPAAAIIDMKIFGLLSMISRLPRDNHLLKLCIYLLHIRGLMLVQQNIIFQAQVAENEDLLME